MFGKGSDQRLDQTIAFIRATPPRGMSAVHHAFLCDQLTTWRQNTPGPIRTVLSGLMSQNGTPNRPASQTDRAYRRATILPKCALVFPQAGWAAEVNQVNGMRAANHRGPYEWAMEAARDHVYSSAVVANANLRRLKHHTFNFLRDHPLIVDSLPTAGATVYGFRMINGKYELSCTQPQFAQVQVRAINIPSTPYASVQANPGAIVPTRASLARDCELMLTTQFIGCCFCFSVNGNRMAAAHIDPQGKSTGVTGQAVSAALRANGDFTHQNGGRFVAYGRVANDSQDPGYPMSADQMIVLAVRRRGQWRVYSQTLVGGAPVATRLHPWGSSAQVQGPAL